MIEQSRFHPKANWLKCSTFACKFKTKGGGMGETLLMLRGEQTVQLPTRQLVSTLPC
jgi:hypothetical protein